MTISENAPATVVSVERIARDLGFDTDLHGWPDPEVRFKVRSEKSGMVFKWVIDVDQLGGWFDNDAANYLGNLLESYL